MAIYLKVNEHERIEIKPTIFPDKTSQVWKVPYIDDLKDTDKVYVYWVFEQEAELIWLGQLADLIMHPIIYIIPYLPYARQDKYIRNHTCFASICFQSLFNDFSTNEDVVHTLDVHSERSYFYIDAKVINYIPYDEIKYLFEETNSNLMLLPDFGAFERYYEATPAKAAQCLKDRDQTTGKINSITLPNYVDFKNKRILIVDDICDGGATFIEIAKQLKEREVSKIALYITHGIFSKGTAPLVDAGITQIRSYNYESFYEKIINEQ
jgi:phosphoribosylpyrophosphate synthetase